MTTWHLEHGRQNASEDALAILDEIEGSLARLYDPRPVIRSIRIGAGVMDLHDFEVEVELAPGAILAVRYQSVDEEGRDPDALGNQAGAVAWLVLDSVADYMAHGATALADELHDLRMRTRRILAGWWTEGTHVTLGDIRFVRIEHTASDDDRTVEARLRGLDGKLRPDIFAVEAEHPDMLETQIEAYRPRMDARFAAKGELARQGADGWIDRLVLNAIAQYDDAATALRTITSWRGYWMSTELTVFEDDGHIRCHGRDRDIDDFGWNRDSVTIHGRAAPDTILTALIGRPVSSLIKHPVLSDDMVITEASNDTEFGMHSIRATFEQPRLLFCSASGRVWLPGNA